jgi:hypothetical protein
MTEAVRLASYHTLDALISGPLRIRQTPTGNTTEYIETGLSASGRGVRSLAAEKITRAKTPVEDAVRQGFYLWQKHQIIAGQLSLLTNVGSQSFQRRKICAT